MMKRAFAAMAVTVALPVVAVADEFRYTYLEGGYQYLDIDTRGVDVDGDGLGIGGSLAISDRLHLLASYSHIDLDFGIDADEFSAGIGGSWPTSDDVHLIGSVGYVSVEIDTPFGNFDDSGFFLSGGLRWKATDRFELTGELTYADLDDAGDDTTLSVGGLLDLTRHLALGIGVTIGDDATSYTAGLRYYFPGMR